MPAKGRTQTPLTSIVTIRQDGSQPPCPSARGQCETRAPEESDMNKITRSKELMVPKVTTGPISASSKVYVSPEGHPDVRIPLREIALSKESGEPPFRVYDPSGPYTDANATIDVEKGLPRVRQAWVRERGGSEQYQGRELKPEDNGNVAGTHLARDFPNKSLPMRGLPGKPMTQLEFARAGIITKEMIYVAHRENLGRKAALEAAKAKI